MGQPLHGFPGQSVVEVMHRRLALVVVEQERLGLDREHLAADGGTGGFRRPKGKRAPGRVFAVPCVPHRDGELVVALGDAEIAEDGIRHAGDIRDRKVH
jgi:hypothetical protein